jgi:hypothetical protein
MINKNFKITLAFIILILSAPDLFSQRHTITIEPATMCIGEYSIPNDSIKQYGSPAGGAAYIGRKDNTMANNSSADYFRSFFTFPLGQIPPNSTIEFVRLKLNISPAQNCSVNAVATISQMPDTLSGDYGTIFNTAATTGDYMTIFNTAATSEIYSNLNFYSYDNHLCPISSELRDSVQSELSSRKIILRIKCESESLNNGTYGQVAMVMEVIYVAHPQPQPPIYRTYFRFNN